MKKIISCILLTFYLFCVLFVTFYILTFNKYNISCFENITMFVAKETSIFPSGSLVIVKKNNNIKEEDKILYYDTYGSKVTIQAQIVTEIQTLNEVEQLYTLSNSNLLSPKYIIGSVKDATIIPYLGTILDIVSSQLGYLVFFVLPILFVLIYLIHSLREEIKKDRK